MSDKQQYWIRDVEGVYARVDGAEARDVWTKVRGWSDADEPGTTDQVHVVNEHPEVGPGRLPFGAVEDWGGLGWKPGPPPEPIDPTKNAELVDQPENPPTSRPAQPKTAPAATSKE